MSSICYNSPIFQYVPTQMSCQRFLTLFQMSQFNLNKQLEEELEGIDNYNFEDGSPLSATYLIQGSDIEFGEKESGTELSQAEIEVTSK